MKIMLIVLAALLPTVAYSIGAAGDTEWPTNAFIDVRLKLSAAADTNGQLKVSGDLVISNPSDTPLTIQSPHNRLVLAFLVFDSLGNPVAPTGRAKVDPAFETHSLSPRSTYTHHFERLEFITGSALFGYNLSSRKTYRILAVYRPAGPRGPGFPSQEVSLEIPSNAQTLSGKPDETTYSIQAYLGFNGISTSVVVRVGMKIEEMVKVLGEPTHHVQKGALVEGKPEGKYEGWLRWYHNPRHMHVAPSIKARIENGVVRELKANRS